MTSEGYLKARGWTVLAGSPSALTPLDRLDLWIDPDDRRRFGTLLPEAVRIQVRRDRDCAAFVAAYQEEPL